MSSFGRIVSLTRWYYVNCFPTILSIMARCTSGGRDFELSRNWLSRIWDVENSWLPPLLLWLVFCSGKFNCWWNRFGKMTLWGIGVLAFCTFGIFNRWQNVLGKTGRHDYFIVLYCLGACLNLEGRNLERSECRNSKQPILMMFLG